MTRRTLTVPEMMFVIGTRAALAAGVALLVAGKLNKTTRRAAGIALAGIGSLTTIPAARILTRRRSLLDRIGIAA